MKKFRRRYEFILSLNAYIFSIKDYIDFSFSANLFRSMQHYQLLIYRLLAVSNSRLIVQLNCFQTFRQINQKKKIKLNKNKRWTICRPILHDFLSPLWVCVCEFFPLWVSGPGQKAISQNVNQQEWRNSDVARARARASSRTCRSKTWLSRLQKRHLAL